MSNDQQAQQVQQKKLPRKHLFALPPGIVYLDGNSLGPLPKAVPDRVSQVLKHEWGDLLIGGWNEGGWMAQPGRVGDKIAQQFLHGAPPGSVVMGDTLSIKVYQALAAALEMQPDRKVVLSDTGNFPTDLYMATGLMQSLDKGHELKTVAPADVVSAIDENVAAVLLTQVDYRTGRCHDMEAITKAAHAAGAVMIWDLAHSAGAVPVDLAASHCEFAVGCTYKYMNGGPGAPAFIYVRPDLVDQVRPALAGWLGHEAPFAFDRDYRPAHGIERMRVGTPPVIQMTTLEAALEVWEGLTMQEVREASIRLCELFIAQVEARCPDLQLASPRNPQERGSQVSFSHKENNGYAVMQALIARGVIGDFRAPDLLRFGITPLYLDETDIEAAVGIIAEVLDKQLWDDPTYKAVKKVT